MPFPWTLQRYLCRELGKTFVLASLTLMVVLGLGGGVLNMIKLGGVSPGQLFRLMALVLPLSAALTLPVAALFSATATYGRFSSDNEFVACRASGINLHVLFLPTVLLSLFAAGISFGLTNFVIPQMVRNLNAFVGSDFGALIEQRINQPRGLTLGGNNMYRIYADRCITDQAFPDRVTLQKVVWVAIDQGDWERYGTFRELHLRFHSDENPPRISAVAIGVHWYDRKLGRYFENERQSIASSQVPSFVPPKIKFLNLNELFHYLKNPTDWHEVRERMTELRTDSGRLAVLQTIWDDLQHDKEVTLGDSKAVYTLHAARRPAPLLGDWLELGSISVDERRADRRRTITAERANIEITHGETLAQCGIRIEAYEARLSSGSGTLTRGKVTLGPVAIDPELVKRLDSRTDAELLAPGTGIVAELLEKKRQEVLAEKGATVRHIVGAINERIASSVSVFALVILAAALGVVFRGSQVIAAFGISFVPAIFVIVAIVMGKQMAQNEGTHGLGLTLIWGGIGLVTALDGWVLMRVLRR